MTGLFVLLVLSGSVAADEKRFEVGVRSVMITPGGEPANDMIAGGVYGEYRLSGGTWFVGAALDQYSYDFERPWKVLGLVQDPNVDVIDTPADALQVSGWFGGEYGAAEKRLHWVWTAGLGFSSPSADDVTGPLMGTGTFDITTDPGTEIIISATGGLRYRVGERWSLQFGLRVDHHLADWTVLDRVSDTTATVSDYTGIGGNLGFGFRF